MGHTSLQKNNGRMIVQLVLASAAGLITLAGLFLYLFEMVDILIVLLSAILANLIQFGLIKGLIKKLKNLVIQANELEVCLGNRTLNVGADGIIRYNAAYARTMTMNALISLILPWVLVFTSVLI